MPKGPVTLNDGDILKITSVAGQTANNIAIIGGTTTPFDYVFHKDVRVSGSLTAAFRIVDGFGSYGSNGQVPVANGGANQSPTWQWGTVSTGGGAVATFTQQGSNRVITSTGNTAGIEGESQLTFNTSTGLKVDNKLDVNGDVEIDADVDITGDTICTGEFRCNNTSLNHTNWSAGYAVVAHKDKNVSSADYALLHGSNGRTYINGSSAGGGIYFRIDNSSNYTTIYNTNGFNNLYSDGKIGRDTTDYITFTDNTQMDVYLNGANEFRFKNNGDFHADGDVVAFSSTVSDSRLKDNVIPIGNALNKIISLRGVEYDWNSGKRTGKHDLGFIAQEVEKIIPDIVKEKQLPFIDDTDTLYKTIDYEKIIPVLVEAIKDQQKQIDNLKEQINNR